jgi:hypothetical protein
MEFVSFQISKIETIKDHHGSLSEDREEWSCRRGYLRCRLQSQGYSNRWICRFKSTKIFIFYFVLLLPMKLWLHQSNKPFNRQITIYKRKYILTYFIYHSIENSFRGWGWRYSINNVKRNFSIKTIKTPKYCRINWCYSKWRKIVFGIWICW